MTDLAAQLPMPETADRRCVELEIRGDVRVEERINATPHYTCAVEVAGSDLSLLIGLEDRSSGCLL